jgi:hypothetical protein
MPPRRPGSAEMRVRGAHRRPSAFGRPRDWGAHTRARIRAARCSVREVLRSVRKARKLRTARTDDQPSALPSRRPQSAARLALLATSGVVARRRQTVVPETRQRTESQAVFETTVADARFRMLRGSRCITRRPGGSAAVAGVGQYRVVSFEAVEPRRTRAFPAREIPACAHGSNGRPHAAVGLCLGDDRHPGRRGVRIPRHRRPARAGRHQQSDTGDRGTASHGRRRSRPDRDPGAGTHGCARVAAQRWHDARSDRRRGSGGEP